MTAREIYADTLRRFQEDIDSLTERVRECAASSRRDLPGVHLYMNADLLFDVLPYDKIAGLNSTYAAPFKEAESFKNGNASTNR